MASLVTQASDVEELQESATGAWDTFVGALPRVGIAVGVLAAFVVTGRLLRPLIRRRLVRRRTPSFARVFAKLTSSAMSVSGVLLAVTIVFPSVRPVDVLTGAGVLTIAAGFAFQDILQNMLAGILLLFRQPFRGGDQIRAGEVMGTVEEINIRETVITTFDGRRVLVPNAKVYTDVIHVQTAHQRIRAGFVVGIAYEADMAAARTIAADAVAGVDGVAADPAPEAIYVELAELHRRPHRAVLVRLAPTRDAADSGPGHRGGQERVRRPRHRDAVPGRRPPGHVELGRGPSRWRGDPRRKRGPRRRRGRPRAGPVE